MNIKRKKNILALCINCLALLFAVVTAHASSVGYEITFICADSDGKVVMSEEIFRGYRIDTEIDWNKVDEAETAAKLASEIKQSGREEDFFFKTDAGGRSLVALQEGCWLVVGENFETDTAQYTPTAFVLRLDSKMAHALTCYVKYTVKKTDEPAETEKNTGSMETGEKTETEKKTTSSGAGVKTGDDTPLILWIGILLGTFMIIGLTIHIRRKER